VTIQADDTADGRIAVIWVMIDAPLAVPATPGETWDDEQEKAWRQLIDPLDSAMRALDGPEVGIATNPDNRIRSLPNTIHAIRTKGASMADTEIREADAYSPDDFARRIGLGRTTTYRLIRDGELRSIKVGRRRLIPADEIRRLLSAAS
jgi:excisionase family DNA binding protein